jgi:hypothetical protein
MSSGERRIMNSSLRMTLFEGFSAACIARHLPTLRFAPGRL